LAVEVVDAVCVFQVAHVLRGERPLAEATTVAELAVVDAVAEAFAEAEAEAAQQHIQEGELSEASSAVVADGDAPLPSTPLRATLPPLQTYDSGEFTTEVCVSPTAQRAERRGVNAWPVSPGLVVSCLTC
jgi:hypothetical protein